MLIHGELEPFDAGALQNLAQHEQVPERPVAGLHQHAGAQHGVAQRPPARHDLHLGHVLVSVGGPEGVLDIPDRLLGGLAAHAPLGGPSAAHLVAGQPEARIFAERLLAGHVAALGGLVVDVEGVEARIVVHIQFEDEARGGIDAAAGGHLDGPALVLARPVDHERLRVDGDVHLRRQAALTGQERAREGAVHLTAAAMDEVEDRVVVGAAGKPGADDRPAHRGLVGDPREHVSRQAAVPGVDPVHPARDEHATPARLALVVAVLGRLVDAAPHIEVAMLADGETPVGAAFGGAGEAALQRPGIVGDSLDLLGDGRVRADRTLALACLALDGRFLALGGRDHPVVGISILAGPGLAGLRPGRHAEIGAVGCAAMVGLDRERLFDDPGTGSVGDPEIAGRGSHGLCLLQACPILPPERLFVKLESLIISNKSVCCAKNPTKCVPAFSPPFQGPGRDLFSSIRSRSGRMTGLHGPGSRHAVPTIAGGGGFGRTLHGGGCAGRLRYGRDSGARTARSACAL